MKKAADMQIKTFWQKVGRRLMGLGYGSGDHIFGHRHIDEGKKKRKMIKVKNLPGRGLSSEMTGLTGLPHPKYLYLV